MILTAVLCFVVLFVLAVLWWYYLQWRYILYLRDIPGPTKWPLMGNVLELSSTVDFIPKLVEWQNKYGDIYQISFGFQQPHLIISDHTFLQFLLGSTKILDKSINYRFLHSWLGQGLLTSTGSKWKSHRKVIVPAFHFRILEQFVEIFEKNGNIFIEKLKQEVNSESFDIYAYVNLLSLDIICESALGTEVNAQKDSHSDYVKSVKFMCKTIMERMFSPLKQYDFFYQFTQHYQEEKRALQILHGTTDSVIRQRKEILQSKVPVSDLDEDFGIKKKLAFLDLLLESTIDGKSMSDVEIREEVDTFMFEGHDTVSAAISFTLYLLSNHPNVQEKIVEELQAVFGSDNNRPCTYNDLQEMKYLEAVIKEALRLYPSVPIYGRTLSEDIEYEGVLIPKGTILIVFAYGIARKSNFFEDPDKFNPERFLSYTLSNQYPYAYLPFSAGPRNCIGQKYAMLEMKFIITKFLRNYEILPVSPHHELVLSSETTLQSKSGWNIRIKKRCIAF